MPPPPRCRLCCAQAGEGLREFALKTSNSTKDLGAKAGETLAKAGNMSSTICVNPGGRRTTADAGDEPVDSAEKARWNEDIVTV